MSLTDILILIAALGIWLHAIVFITRLVNTYQVGEVVLLEYMGWLKAFRVVRVYTIDGENVEYTLTMVEREGGPEWSRPD